jgi:hypothetical protein
MLLAPIITHLPCICCQAPTQLSLISLLRSLQGGSMQWLWTPKRTQRHAEIKADANTLRGGEQRQRQRREREE